MITALLLALPLLLQPPAQPTSSPVAPAANAQANPATNLQPRTDPGWGKRNEAFNALAKRGHEQGDIGVVFLGDSITEGWEREGKEVWEKTYAPRHAVNMGIGGDRTQHVLWRIQNGNLEGLARPLKGSPPKLAVIMIGTNNTGSDSAAQIAEGISAVVDATHEKLPDAKILLLGVFPRSEKPTETVRTTLARINTRAAKLTDKPWVTYLDIGDKFLSVDGTLTAEIMPDRLHLSPKGYQIWADAIEPTVHELLGEPAKH
jgi:lysophospholipase L1-like esterase